MTGAVSLKNLTFTLNTSLKFIYTFCFQVKITDTSKPFCPPIAPFTVSIKVHNPPVFLKQKSKLFYPDTFIFPFLNYSSLITL